jgi:urea transport system substrate-binding protein
MAEPRKPAAVDSTGVSRSGDKRIRIGMRLGNYTVLNRIGKGGAGTVYEAEEVGAPGRRVAVKVLSENRSSDDRALHRFQREALAAGKLRHPHVVTVHQFGEENGIYFLVMDLVRGFSAQTSLDQNGPFEWAEATRIAADCARGLSAAHAAGMIHRDIKPANILYSNDGKAKLTDFGLVKLLDATAEVLTREGKIVGTAYYISPEQCAAQKEDFRADIYGLGATYFALLTAKPPYDFKTPVEVLRAHLEMPIPDPRALNPAVPEACVAIINKAMSKKPEDRFQSAAEMLAALEGALKRAPAGAGAASDAGSSGGVPLWAVIAAAIALAAVGAWLIFGRS